MGRMGPAGHTFFSMPTRAARGVSWPKHVMFEHVFRLRTWKPYLDIPYGDALAKPFGR